MEFRKKRFCVRRDAASTAAEPLMAHINVSDADCVRITGYMSVEFDALKNFDCMKDDTVRQFLRKRK